jgi:Tetratricopeptide repeat
MTETHSSKTLSALLAVEASENELAPARMTTTEDSESVRLPTLDERTDMFLKAVYGPDRTVTPEMRLAARNQLLSAMTSDLSDEENHISSEADAIAPTVHSRIGLLISDGFSQISAGANDVWHKVVPSAAKLFASHSLRIAAVPLVALLVVGSAWSVSCMNSDDHLSNPTVEANNTAVQAMPKSRGLGQPVHPVETEQSLEREIAADETALGPSHPTVAQKLVDLASLYRSEGRYHEAEVLCTRALAIQDQTIGAKDPETIRTLKELAMVYRAQGRNREADDLLARGHLP